MLEKYHQVPDGLIDFKSQFHFLKEATSRNIENLQQALNLQQTYTTTLCGHVNVIFSRNTKLETDIQKLTEKFTTEQDTVQIDALDFDPDIDGPDTQCVHHTTVSIQELFTSPEPESADASNTQEETIDRDQPDSSHPNSEDPFGLTISPNKFQTIRLRRISQDNNSPTQQNTMFLMKSHY